MGFAFEIVCVRSDVTVIFSGGAGCCGFGRIGLHVVVARGCGCWSGRRGGGWDGCALVGLVLDAGSKRWSVTCGGRLGFPDVLSR